MMGEFCTATERNMNEQQNCCDCCQKIIIGQRGPTGPIGPTDPIGLNKLGLLDKQDPLD